ncbi:AAA family ATPase [uncultured Jatrophihabitans sp.]|uniref:ATP-binding protein n=1 Tax=uncultured Jatrophihabitans sp. TaxID=1610747 RepID=UPI0035CBBAD5
MDDELIIASLRRAVEHEPEDTVLRLHLAVVLLDTKRYAEAIAEAAAVLQHDPGLIEAREVMVRALGTATPGSVTGNAATPDPARPGTAQAAAASSQDSVTAPGPTSGFDWSAAETEVSDVAQPMFVDDAAAPTPSESAFDIERSTVTLADVGGMTEVKKRLHAAFLAPLRNAELRSLYGKSLRGGLLLYGPPGCGKTFLARAVAGELGAAFVSVGLSDVLDMYIGTSERNLHEVFQLARREAPTVLFFDEIDALGQKRTQTRSSALRGATNQLLAELDGVEGGNDGVFVLAATNQPWDVDPALRRPGRLDRTLLVLPPDRPAREQIFRHHLERRPVEGMDLGKLAGATEGMSGADIAHICETAAEQALVDSVESGTPRLINFEDLRAAVREVRPSVTGWLDTARNVVQFGDDDGTYEQLRSYLRKVKRL